MLTQKTNLDWQMYDHPWSHQHISLLINGEHYRTVEGDDGITHTVETLSNGAYGLRLEAVDHARYEAMLDVMQLDNLLKEHVTDNVVAAALTLRIAGWKPESIGTVLRSHKPGSRLIEDGITMIYIGEKNKDNLRKEAANA